MSDVYTKDKAGRMRYTIKNKFRLDGVVVVIETRKINLTPEEVRKVWDYIDSPEPLVLNEDDFCHLTEEEWDYIVKARIQIVSEEELEAIIGSIVIPTPVIVEVVKPKRTRKPKEKV